MIKNIVKCLLFQLMCFIILFSLMLFFDGSNKTYDFLRSNNDNSAIIALIAIILNFCYVIYSYFVLTDQGNLLKNLVSVSGIIIFGIILWLLAFINSKYNGIVCVDCQHPHYNIFKLMYDSYILPLYFIGVIISFIFTNGIDFNEHAKEYFISIDVFMLITVFLISGLFILGLYIRINYNQRKQRRALTFKDNNS